MFQRILVRQSHWKIGLRMWLSDFPRPLLSYVKSCEWFGVCYHSPKLIGQNFCFISHNITNKNPKCTSCHLQNYIYQQTKNVIMIIPINHVFLQTQHNWCKSMCLIHQDAILNRVLSWINKDQIHNITKVRSQLYRPCLRPLNNNATLRKLWKISRLGELEYLQLHLYRAMMFARKFMIHTDGFMETNPTCTSH